MLDDLNIRIERDAPLAGKTWYGCGGAAKYLAHPASVEELALLLQCCHAHRVPVYALGSGANLLVRESGVDGCVVQLDAPAFDHARLDGTRAIAGAGFDLMKLVLLTAKEGLAGLEVVAGIPASVGGAVRMNAGGTYGDVGRSVASVTVMSDKGEVYQRDRDDLVFSYRKSNIAAPFILEVTFELQREEPEDVMRRVKEIFLYKKNTQPMGDRSAGCAFKNPPRKEEDDAPPLSAGSLIDKAGLKGYRVGGAEVSAKHANFIVTHEGCRADDVLAVMDHVQRVVKQRFGVDLQREVVVWP